MKILPTVRTDYAIRALIYLATHPTRRVKATEIAREMAIPEPILRQVLGELQRANLVASRPGPRGGYWLATHPAHMSLLRVIEAMEGPNSLDQCAMRGGPCHWEEVCAVHGIWSEARAAFAEVLAAHTVAEVADVDRRLRERTAEIPPDSHRRPRAVQGPESKSDRPPAGSGA